MSIQADLQSLNPGSVIDMFEVDATRYSLGFLRYCAHVNFNNTDIVWRGDVYVRFPVIASGFEKSSKGVLPRPVVTIANVGGLLAPLFRSNNNLLGCKVTRRRTLVKYLDAANFVGGVNPTADPNTFFPDEIFFIDRKAAETDEFISVELALAWDVTGVKLPLRQVIRDTCMWAYRGPDCSYTGAAVAKADDTPTAVLGEDKCSKRRSGCVLRFGVNGQLPASFYPAVGLLK